MKKILSICLTLVACILGGVTVEAANNVKPLTQYYLVDGGSGMATLRSKSEMGRMLKTLGFKIVSTGKTFKATRNGTTVVMTKIRNGDKCVVTFATQAEVNDFVDSMVRSKWYKSGNEYRHPEFMFGGGVTATIKGRTVTLIFYWDGSI